MTQRSNALDRAQLETARRALSRKREGLLDTLGSLQEPPPVREPGDAADVATAEIADRHYASDVLVGTGIGFDIGYAVPVLLHYSRGARQIAIGPDLTCGGTCLGVGGTF